MFRSTENIAWNIPIHIPTFISNLRNIQKHSMKIMLVTQKTDVDMNNVMKLNI